MHRLNFILPDFVRVSWISEDVQGIWEPRLIRIRKAWDEIEWMSVHYDIRRCAVVIISPDNLASQAVKWLERGLIGVPIEVQDCTDGLSVRRTDEGNQYSYVMRIAVTKFSNSMTFHRALKSESDEELSLLLGYPECCYRFAQQTWMGGDVIDPSWLMAVGNTPKSYPETYGLELGCCYQTNMFWRWLGLRAVPHIPCAFACPFSIDIANKFLELGCKCGYASEMQWLTELLSWPVEWSALHGIAEIKTPLLKICTRTDATAYKYTVRILGNAYPSEGVQGLNFPYQAPTPLITLKSRGRSSRNSGTALSTRSGHQFAVPDIKSSMEQTPEAWR